MNNALEAILAKNINKFDKDINKLADKLAQKEFKKLCKSAEHEAYMQSNVTEVVIIPEVIEPKETSKPEETSKLGETINPGTGAGAGIGTGISIGTGTGTGTDIGIDIGTGKRNGTIKLKKSFTMPV
jgi:hypothetical protein